MGTLETIFWELVGILLTLIAGFGLFKLGIPVVTVPAPFLASDYQAGNVNLAGAVWTTMATLTVPAARLTGGPVMVLVNGTGDRSSGSGDVSVRLRRGDAVVRMEASEMELSGSTEHGQFAMMVADMPPANADAVYAVDCNATGNLSGTVHARQLAVIGGFGA